MDRKDANFVGTIPDIYDQYMVPLIFEHYAEDLANRTAALAPGRVLETAAGSGVVTRAVTPRLADGASYAVTDLNMPMLDRARAQQAGDTRLDWREANAQDLPFDDDSFDLVLCQFGIMFFADRQAGFAEARRVLNPGGKAIMNIWDRLEANAFAHAVSDAVAEMFPEDPPQFLPRTPYGYFNADQIRADAQAAGFAHVEPETVPAISRAPDARFAAVAYVHGTPLRSEIEARNPEGLAEATDRAEATVAARFRTSSIEAPMQAIVVTAHD